MSQRDVQIQRFQEALEVAKERGATNEQLAARVGTSARNFDKWSAGMRPVPAKHRRKVARILGVRVDWLRAADYVLDGETATPHPSELEAMREALFADLDGLRAIVLKIAQDEPLLPAELDALRTRSQPPGTSDEDNRPGQAA